MDIPSFDVLFTLVVLFFMVGFVYVVCLLNSIVKAIRKLIQIEQEEAKFKMLVELVKEP